MNNAEILLAARSAVASATVEQCESHLRAALEQKRGNDWEIEEALGALAAGNLMLCLRYVDKALERVRCMYCHEPLSDERPYRAHYEGFVHVDCGDTYDGYRDYLIKNGLDPWRPGPAN